MPNIPFGKCMLLNGMFSTPGEIILNLMAVMLRVGMQGIALRADIPDAKFAWQISVPQLVDTPGDEFAKCCSRDNA